MSGQVAQTVSREDWLSLGQAAEMLGVHPATLRLWADQGEIPSQRTPGGHRRFRRPDIKDRMSLELPHQSDAEAELVVHSAMGKARLDAGDGRLAAEPWHSQLDDTGRQQHQRLGRELAALLLRYLASEDETVLEEARRVGHEYGLAAQRSKLGLTAAVRAFLYFHDALTDSTVRILSTGTTRSPAEWVERFRRVNQFTNEVLLALVSAYEEDEAADGGL